MATSTIYFNRAGAIELDIGTVDFAHYAQITLKIGNTVIHTSDNLAISQDSYNWTPTEAEKASIIELIPTNATSVKGIMKKDVFWSVNNSEANLYDREFEVTFVLESTESTKPVISNNFSKALELTDSATASTYVQSKSRLQYTLNAVAQNNASIKSVTVKVRGVACTLTSSDGNKYVFESGLLAYSGTNTISVEVTDSRGFKRTLSENIYVHPYAPPIMSSLASEDGIVCKRWSFGSVDEVNGTECRVKVSVAMSYVPNILSSYSVYCHFRATGETAWSEEKLIGTMEVGQSGSTIFEATIPDATFDIDFEYDIELKVVDALGGINTRYEQLPGSKVSYNIKPNGMGVSVGKYATEDNLFDSAWDIHSDSNIIADGKVSSTSIETDKLVLGGTEVKVTADEINSLKGIQGEVQMRLTQISNSASATSSNLQHNYYNKTSIDSFISSIESRLKALEK